MRATAILLLFLAALPGVAAAQQPPAWQGKTAAQWAAAVVGLGHAGPLLRRLCPGATRAGVGRRRRGAGQKTLKNRPEQEYVRAGAAWALGRIGPAARPAAPLLTETLASTLISVRRNSAEALGNLGTAAKPAVPALIAALGDTDSGVRAAAAAGIVEESKNTPRPCRP